MGSGVEGRLAKLKRGFLLQRRVPENTREEYKSSQSQSCFIPRAVLVNVIKLSSNRLRIVKINP